MASSSSHNTTKRLLNLTLTTALEQQPRPFWSRRRRLFLFLAAGIVAVLVVASGVVFSPFASLALGTNPTTAHTYKSTTTTSSSNISSSSTTSSSFSHKLCVLTRVHNVPRSLAEWLEYHLAVGVGHFFIFDDCSNDEGNKTAWVLDTYKRLGLISVFNAEDLTRWDCRVNGNAKARAGAGWRWSGSWSWPLRGGSDKSDDKGNEECVYACGDRHQPDEDRLFSFLHQQMQMKARQAQAERGGGGGGGQGCEWTGVYDVDEYLTIHREEEDETLLSSSAIPPALRLHALLDERSKEGLPVFQLPWVMMGSDGHMRHTPAEGLVIEGSLQGAYTAWMLKTLARTEVVEDWRHSHWPQVREGVREDGWRVPEAFLSLKEYVERVWLKEEESRTVFREEEEEEGKEEGEEAPRACRAPVSPLYLKHYFYRSFEEWKAHRGRSPVQPDGGPNTHLVDLRSSWEEGQDPDMFWAPCHGMYDHNFTLKIMAPLVRQGLEARRRHWGEEEEEEGGGGWKAFPPVETWLL